MIEMLNMDCLEYMSTLKDKTFDLACVDPEYGIGQNKNNGKSMGLRKKWKGYVKQKYKQKDWDNKPASAEYFKEIMRVSRNQIICGSNYFDLPPSRGIAAWDKKCDGTGFSDFELIWTSFDKSAKIFRLPIQDESQCRIHPTQKPVKLYNWLFHNYAEKGQRILDTHGGSFSSAIAAHYFGVDMVICEIDEDYFKAGKERFERETKQIAMF